MTWPWTARPTRWRSRSPARTASSGSAGTAGQEVSINLGSSVADTDYQILKPNGNVLDSGSFDSSGEFIEPFTLPVDGTYKLVLDPQSFFLGGVTTTLYDVPADATAAGAHRLDHREHRLDARPERGDDLLRHGGAAGQPDRVRGEHPGQHRVDRAPERRDDRAVLDRHERPLHEPGHAATERHVHRPRRPVGVRHRAHVARSRARGRRSRLRDRRERRPRQRVERRGRPERAASRSPGRQARRSAWSSPTRRWARPTSRS